MIELLKCTITKLKKRTFLEKITAAAEAVASKEPNLMMKSADIPQSDQGAHWGPVPVWARLYYWTKSGRKDDGASLASAGSSDRAEGRVIVQAQNTMPENFTHRCKSVLFRWIVWWDTGWALDRSAAKGSTLFLVTSDIDWWQRFYSAERNRRSIHSSDL